MEEDKNAPRIQAMQEELDEMSQTLRQMLLLAELSASDNYVDRASLQKGLERMRDHVDQIADRLGELRNHG